ncbi:UNVERIFIED_ORG: hypothetical protein Xoosp15_87 [Xanthomonas phage Xoo-sp15]
MQPQLQQPQGKQINPNYVFSEQQVALFDLMNENIRLKAYIAQLEAEKAQAELQANEPAQPQ